MDLTIEYKGQKRSKMTISSLGPVRVKIADKDKEVENEIINKVIEYKNKLGVIDFTIRAYIIVKGDKIKFTFTDKNSWKHLNHQEA